MSRMDNGKIPFIPGLKLCECFSMEVVNPLLEQLFPGLLYTACLIGYGSDVIGCDTPMSRDHLWGPRLILFLPEGEFEDQREKVDACLRSQLPHMFLGYPTSFSPPNEEGTRLLDATLTGPVDHLIEITTIPAYFDRELGSRAWQSPASADWLSFSEHRLLTLTAGGVFHDDLGLQSIRERLAYYPKDVWLYLLASAWSEIGQEEPFVGRCGDNGDDLGSRIIAARLAQTCMRLAFLLERRYAPYSKWFGTLFSRLAIGQELLPHLTAALEASHWKDRETALCRTYEVLASALNALDIIPTVEARCSAFHNRPFQVIHGDQIAAQLQRKIEDPVLKRLGLYGSVNQFSQSTDLLENNSALVKLRDLYG